MKFFRVFLRILIVILVILFVYSGFLIIQTSHAWKNTYNEVKKKPTVNELPQKDDNIISILLMGLDTTGLSSDKFRGRSDANLLLSLNTVTDQITFVSVPRDIRIEIFPEKKDKLGHAFMYGPEISLRVVEDLLFFPIDYYVAVKENVVEEIIDVMGGLNIDVEEEYAADSDDIDEGMQRLNGEDVMYYIRFRKDSKNEGDFGRIRRQQQVLDAMLHQILTPTAFFNIYKFFDIAEDNVQHNIPIQIIRKHGLRLTSLSSDDINKLSIEGNNIEIDSLWYVIPDRRSLIQVRKELLLELEKAK